ncbi:hypothetical protein [Clostridium sp. Ade.TY]|uniref:hypothetical protein n=1 Tax=Clostridium sp. Ade.TY TaxID=1391647 RepID=UPI0004126D33|nr:hypothetical protein [Clostridium sp. Ade.TY]
MSRQKDLEKLRQLQESCKYNGDNLIVYIDSKNNDEIEDIMKKGYQEMAFLNLQLALMTEHELVDVDDYETWLCGE